jgi:hypothetical protein
MGLVVEAGAAQFSQAIEEVRDPLQPMVIAGQLGKPGVEEVEHDVSGEQVSVQTGEAIDDVRPDPSDQVHVLLLRCPGVAHRHLEIVAVPLQQTRTTSR